MDAVITLMADALDPRIVAEARAGLNRLGAETGQPDWLSPGRACDIPFEMLAVEQADAVVRDLIDGAPIDVVAQPCEHRKKRLLIADMDSTVVTSETLDELAAFAGVKDAIAAITTRAMAGEIPFREALLERVAMLKGLPEEALEQTWQTTRITPGAASLVATMRKNGAYCMLVSGGFRHFTKKVKKQLGFDEEAGNSLKIKDGKLTGKVKEPLLGKDAKLEKLIAAASAKRIPLAASLAVGDGANDLPMLKAAGLGVAFHAKPLVAASARARIEHGDLGALLYLQGYRDDEIVRPKGT